MNIGLLVITIVLLLICVVLILKMYLIKKSIKEIEKSITSILNSDTNNIITISSSDKDIRDLAINLNNNIVDLRRQKLQYQNGNQELKKIVTNISHDLRTPLTSLKGYVDLIDQEELSNNQKKYLEIIQKKSDDLTELTEQLFAFFKIVDTMDSQISIPKENCCINEILEETLLSFYNIFKEKNIIPIICICDKKIYRKANKNSIIRIFETIISNASKYSNGKFKVEMNEDGKISFTNEAKLLDLTTVNKIFDRYFSVENARESTGIGLSIAKQLVELNNGKIYAKYENNNLIVEILL